MLLSPPYLSRHDPVSTSEGSIDPLSLQTVYERLAERILPFITVRMSRPRFLTAMAVGAHVCSEFIEDLAADERSPAWLVFEWHVVEGLVRCRQNIGEDQFRGIPGIRKVDETLQAGKHLGAAGYLKTPKVFGYNGVYRRLSRGLEILDDNFGLDEGGFELLGIWEKEQKLPGFLSDRNGRGAELREDLCKAVRAAMRRGYTCQSSTWPYWGIITTHLRPDEMGEREAERITARLSATNVQKNPSDEEAVWMRREFLSCVEHHGRLISFGTEAPFFRSLIQEVSPGLRERLKAIDAYEALCRPISDAFQLILHLSTKGGTVPVNEADFASEDLARQLAGTVVTAVQLMEEAFSDTPYWNEVRHLVDRYSDVRTPGALFRAVVEHHKEAQRNKPPDGKMTWFVEMRGGHTVRPPYRYPDPPDGTDTYVHDYRTNTVCTFLQDLRRMPR